MKEYFIKEKGFISIFVTFVMIFLLVFVLVSYNMVTTRLKNQKLKDIELQEIYSESFNDIEDYVYADSKDIIPVYNIKELNRVGSGDRIQIKDMIYQCGISNSYALKSDIWIDINEDLLTGLVEFSDFKLFNSLYSIDKGNKDIYYDYEYEDGNTWKTVAYQKFSEKDIELVTNKTYLQDKFSIVNSFDYKNLNDLTFMIIWSDEDGAFNNLKIDKQSNIPSRLEEIKVFKDNYEYIDKQSGEFYVLVNI